MGPKKPPPPSVLVRDCTYPLVLNHNLAHSMSLNIPGVADPGPGEPKGELAFVVTQRLIDQLKQSMTPLTRLTLGSELIADFRVKTKHCDSPGPALAHPCNIPPRLPLLRTGCRMPCGLSLCRNRIRIMIIERHCE